MADDIINQLNDMSKVSRTDNIEDSIENVIDDYVDEIDVVRASIEQRRDGNNTTDLFKEIFNKELLIQIEQTLELSLFDKNKALYEDTLAEYKRIKERLAGTLRRMDDIYNHHTKISSASQREIEDKMEAAFNEKLDLYPPPIPKFGSAKNFTDEDCFNILTGNEAIKNAGDLKKEGNKPPCPLDPFDMIPTGGKFVFNNCVVNITG